MDKQGTSELYMKRGVGKKTHKAVGAFTFHDRITRTVHREHAGPTASHRVSPPETK